jgi:cytochrome c556
MKANVKMMKVMVPVLKGESAYDKAAMDAVIAEAEQACAGWDSWWGEDTKPGGAVKTEAKAEIWTDKAGFDAATADYVKAFTAVKASADEASFKAAFPALGASCKGCHEKYRQAD